jgi:CDP-diacylglycerol--glycerol-3-phosphate 3-phosphatidyltransferase
MNAGLPASLRRRWWLAVGVAVLAAGLVVVAVTRSFTPVDGVLWLCGAAVPTGYTLWVLRRSLGLNHPPESASGTDGVADERSESAARAGASRTDGGKRLYPTLGLANGITLGRGWLYAGVAGFLLVVPPAESVWRWLPALWYGTGILLDWVDGAVARSVSRRTVLGERLDLAFDTLGFLVAPLVGVVWGALPVWYLAISAARYLFKFGCWLRRRRGLPVYDLPESRLRRALAGLQMVFIAAALLPVTPPAVVWPAATVVMTPSLVVFARDYFVVSGRLREANANRNPDPTWET